MKTFLFLCLLWLGFLKVEAQPFTNAVPAITNTLAIYLAGNNASDQKPILADADFVAWNVTNHSFTITPAAAMRLAGTCTYRIVPFFLFANGEQIYMGKFGTSVSSASEKVPIILADQIVTDCFMGSDLPKDVHLMIGRAEPGITERLMALTNATTNVTLQIDDGYPGSNRFRIVFGFGMDVRADKRIAIAVEKLFRSRKK